MVEEKIDYEKTGFKAGLEIHQQLDTDKLFCNCPSFLRTDEPHFSVRRRLHAIAGETGKIDAAVKHEAVLDKEFVYQGYNDTICLIELDEEPPREINQKALEEAMKIALLLNCEIYPASQIMRKTVIDGSNTSGFQRTIVIAHDGYVETSFGKVAIDAVFLEEDSARPAGKNENEDVDSLKENEKQTVCKLDRLGIPLVEIATGPHMHSPQQVKEAALKIGEILRACKVKRGIGTIRQDINVSVKGGDKVEIKGFQDPAMMVAIVDNEINRQLGLHEIYNYLKRVKERAGEFKKLNNLFEKTNCQIIKKAIEKGVVFGVKIPQAAGLLGKELQKNKRFGTEISFRAKIHGVGGIIHSDEDLKKYQISDGEIDAIKKELEINEKDAFILIADEEHKAQKAIVAAISRVNEQYDIAVPREVRGALIDGTTDFRRPMPGGARMYPETDLLLLRIGREKINEIKKHLPKLRQEIKEELRKKGLSEEMINLVLDGNLDEFETLLKVYSKDANLVAKMVTLWRNESATKANKSLDEIKNILTERVLEEILEALVKKQISEGDIKEIFSKIISGTSLQEAIKIEKIDDNRLEEQIAEIIKEKPGFRPNAYMGLIIQKLGPNTDKRKAMEILNRLVK